MGWKLGIGSSGGRPLSRKSLIGPICGRKTNLPSDARPSAELEQDR